MDLSAQAQLLKSTSDVDPWETLHSRVRSETRQSVSQAEFNQPKWKSHIPTAQSQPVGNQQQQGGKGTNNWWQSDRNGGHADREKEDNWSNSTAGRGHSRENRGSENAGFISNTGLLALVLLQHLIKPSETRLGDSIHPRHPQQVIKPLRPNGSNSSA